MENDVITDKKLPLYFKETYGWFYGNKVLCRLLDNSFCNYVLTLGRSQAIKKSLQREIRPGSKVLQLGIPFGSEIEEIADQIGMNGRYDVVDISKAAIHRARKKYEYLFPQLRFINQNAARAFREKDYDVVICYMLLHEVPIVEKTKIVNNALRSINPQGKVIFIDYHNPWRWHPLRYFIRMFNRLLQPFAEKMWDREVETYATRHQDFRWRKVLFGGGLYQKTVAEPRKPANLV